MLKKTALLLLFINIFVLSVFPSDLIRFTINGSVDKVEKLLQQRENVDFRDSVGGTALLSAAIKGRTKIAKLLLENGADPNLAEKLCNTTPLMMASAGKYEKIVEFINIANDLDAYVSNKTTSEQKEKIKKIITKDTDQDLLEIIIGRTSKYITIFNLFNQGAQTNSYRRAAIILCACAKKVANNLFLKYRPVLANDLENDFSSPANALRSLPVEHRVLILLQAENKVDPLYLDLTIVTSNGYPKTFYSLVGEYVDRLLERFPSRSQSADQQSAAQSES